MHETTSSLLSPILASGLIFSLALLGCRGTGGETKTPAEAGMSATDSTEDKSEATATIGASGAPMETTTGMEAGATAPPPVATDTTATTLTPMRPATRTVPVTGTTGGTTATTTH